MFEKTWSKILLFGIPLLLSLLIPLGNPALSEDEKAGGNGLVARGQDLFTSKGCTACHTIGGGKLIGPDLKGMGEKRDVEWLKAWIKAPSNMLTDPIIQELLKEYFVPMPDVGLTDEETEALVKFLINQDSKN